MTQIIANKTLLSWLWLCLALFLRLKLVNALLSWIAALYFFFKYLLNWNILVHLVNRSYYLLNVYGRLFEYTRVNQCKNLLAVVKLWWHAFFDSLWLTQISPNFAIYFFCYFVLKYDFSCVRFLDCETFFKAVEQAFITT